MTLCAKTLEELSAYLDGELGSEGTLAFQRHLNVCTFCQEKMKVLTALEEAVAQSAEASSVPQTLREYVSSLPRHSRWSFLGKSPIVKTLLAFTSLLVVAGSASWWWQQNGAKSRHEEIAQALVADHIHYLQVPDALEIASADPTIISDWFRERVPFPIQIPRLHDGRLLGGRLCSLLGHPAALVLYERGGKRFSLFTLAADAVPLGKKEKRQAANQDNPRCLRTFGRYALCFMSSEDAVLAIVGEESETEDLALSLFRSP